MHFWVIFARGQNNYGLATFWQQSGNSHNNYFDPGQKLQTNNDFGYFLSEVKINYCLATFWQHSGNILATRTIISLRVVCVLSTKTSFVRHILATFWQLGQ